MCVTFYINVTVSGAVNKRLQDCFTDVDVVWNVLYVPNTPEQSNRNTKKPACVCVCVEILVHVYIYVSACVETQNNNFCEFY